MRHNTESTVSQLPATLPDGFTRAMHMLRAGLCEEALAEFRAIYTTAEQAGDNALMAACLCEMGWSCYKLGLAEQGLEFATGARRLREQQGRTVELARALAVQAILFLDLGFSDEAFDLSEQAVALAEQKRDASVLAFALNAKGLALVMCREIDMALPLLERAVSIAVDQGNSAAEAYYLLNLGYCHTQLADDAQRLDDPARAASERQAAVEQSERSIARAESSGDDWTLRVALANTAEMLSLDGRHDLALANLERLAVLPGNPSASLRVHYLYTLGDVLMRSGQLQPARLAVTEALALADATHQVDHQVNASEKLAAILEEMGETSAALALHKRFHALYVQRSGETTRRRARIEEIRSQAQFLRDRASILAEQALSDPLTGIANRRSLDQILNRLAGAPIAIAIVDLDHFKTVNDRYSHIAGDVVLQRVARIMVTHLGPHGHAARLGGEEFALIYPNAPEPTAAAFCEGIRIAVATADWSDIAPELTVTVSIGLAAGNGDVPSGELMLLADKRLYAAKTSGRDRVVSIDAPATTLAAQLSGWRA